MTQLPLDLEAAPKTPRTAALKHFHARDETVAEALAGEVKAARQDTYILGCFQACAPRRMTPSQVAEFFPEWPLTSIRRSLTNLTKAGHLRKHPEDRRLGPRGSKECTWGLP